MISVSEVGILDFVFCTVAVWKETVCHGDVVVRMETSAVCFYRVFCLEMMNVSFVWEV